MRVQVRRLPFITNRLLVASFAVFALVAQPIYGFVAAQVASAVSVIGADGQTHVTTAADLQAAFNDASVTHITLDNDITTTETLLINRSGVRFNGNDKHITFIGDTAGWQGHYVVQVYNTFDVEINSLRVSGGDAGVLINGSLVTIKGNTHVLNNEFGGIEVSRGSAGQNSLLTLQGNLWDESSLEHNGKPAVWVVDGQGSVNDTLSSRLVAATHITSGQTQYYLQAAHTGTVATNTSTGVTYATLQAAFDGASANDTIELNKNIEIAQGETAAHIDTPVVFNGNGFSITTLGTRINSPIQKNAALIVGSTATGTTVKNLTVAGSAATNGGSASHGLIVHQAQNVLLQNITAKNNAGGVMVNAAKVTIDGITTSGNAWYGINVDKTGAQLSIKGNNSHTEAAHIFVDNQTTGASVIDLLSKYEKRVSGNSITYVLDVIAPVAPVITNSPVYVNASQSNNQATWSHTGNDVDHFEYREYRNQAEADADVDGATASYWIQTRTAAERSQTVGQSWTGVQRLYYRVVAVDAAGNRSVPSTLGTVSIDKNVPVITTNIVDTYYRGNLTITEYVSEANPKAYQFYVYNADGSLAQIGGLNVGAYQANPATGELSKTIDTKKLADGRYYVVFSARDLADNTASLKVWFTVDNTRPVVELVTPAGGVVNPTSLTVKSMDNFALHRITANIYNETNTTLIKSCSALVSGEPIAEDTLVCPIESLNLPFGTYTIRYNATDKVGNVAATKTSQFVVAVIETPVDPVDPTDPTDPIDPTDGSGGTDGQTPAIPTLLANNSGTTSLPAIPSSIDTVAPVTTDEGEDVRIETTTPVLEIEEEGEVLGAEDSKSEWSLGSAILAGITALLGLIALVGLARRKDNGESSHVLVRVLTIAPLAAAVIAFFVIEDLSASMVWFNGWTLLFALIAVVQVVLFVLSRKTTES